MKISFVVAVAKNNVIGRKGDLPWYIPEDLKHFKEITEGGTVLMGRKTFESIINRNKKPLPNRTNAVLTRSKDFQAPDGVLVFNDVDKALNSLKCEELFVIGGGTVYQMLMDRADKLYITHVDQEIEGDTYFPEINPAQWKVTKSDRRAGFSFVDYERV